MLSTKIDEGFLCSCDLNFLGIRYAMGRSSLSLGLSSISIMFSGMGGGRRKGFMKAEEGKEILEKGFWR